MSDEPEVKEPQIPSAEEAVIEEQPAAPPQEPQPQSTPAPPGTEEAFDETGVPWKNRASEWKRKLENLTDNLPSLVEEKMKTVLQQHQPTTERQYTIGELESYALDHPEHRGWVEEEKEKIREKKNRSMFEEIVGARENKRNADERKQSALQYVMTTYPDAFSKAENGQISGWNNGHPLTQQIGAIMQDPRFANDPDGLSAAADIAYARFVRGQAPIQRQQQQQLKQEVKDLQKRTLVEGGGRTQTPVADPVRESMNQLKKTGSMKDAELALSAIVKRAREKVKE